MLCKFDLKMPIHALFGYFLGGGIDPLDRTVLTKPPKGTSTAHNSSNSVLTRPMPVSVVVGEKLPGQKRCDDEEDEEEEHDFFGILGIFLK